MAEASTIARPYAEAVFGLAQQAGTFDRWSQTLSLLATISADPVMQSVLNDPHFTDQKLFDLLAGMLGPSLDATGLQFMRTLIESGRLAIATEIGRQFELLKNAHLGRADVAISSAFPLSDAQLDELLIALERRFGVKLNASVSIDPSLIGGVRVVVGDQVLDTSVRTRLEEMRTALAAA